MSTPASQMVTRWRNRRYAERVLVGGRLIAVNAPRHGSHSIYVNWGCRCSECCDAQSAYQESVRAYRKTVAS